MAYKLRNRPIREQLQVVDDESTGFDDVASDDAT
jgi:hypothetical protein